MGRRRVPVDWDDLEVALTFHADEREHFRDLRTGKVRLVRLDAFGNGDDELSDEEIERGLAEGSASVVGAVRVDGGVRGIGERPAPP